MNKFFCFWLFFCTIINTGDLSSSSQFFAKPTSFAHAAKLISFWGTCAVGLETFGYFFDQIKPYEYDNKETGTWSDYFKKKGVNTYRSLYNNSLFCAQSLTLYFGTQFVSNVVRSCSFGPPHLIKFESLNFFMTYFNRCKQSNPYAKVNNILASAAGVCCAENFFEHGWSDLGNLFYMMPVCWKFKMIRFFGGNRISKIGEPFLNGMLLNFELAEYIVKGWSGKYHVNNKAVISLQWFLLLTSSVAFRFYLTQKNKISKGILNFKKDKSRPSNVTKSLYIDYSYVECLIKESSIIKILKELKDDTRLRLKEKHIFQLPNLDSEESYKQKRVLFHRFEDNKKKYQEELARKLFFGNIIALVSGIFFHAFLNACYYCYTQYQKI